MAARTAVFAAATAALGDPPQLPSARVLRRDRDGLGHVFPRFALAQSPPTGERSSTAAGRPSVEARYGGMAAESVAEQQRIEAADDVPFETYRQRYLAQDLMSGAHFRSP